jgi:hypothetical protein
VCPTDVRFSNRPVEVKWSGMKPWTRQLDLCDGWLEIIIEEIKLHGHELSRTEVNALSIDAARIRDRADALVKSLRRRN